MPPKPAQKKKKAKGDQPDDKERYAKALQVIDALEDQLAVRKEFVRKNAAEARTLREGIKKKDESLDGFRTEQKDLTTDMSRQYKTLKDDLGLQVYTLQCEVRALRKNLEETEQTLEKEREENKRVLAEKDAYIHQLLSKIAMIEDQYEKIFHDALDVLEERIRDSEAEWESTSEMLLFSNKAALAEFGINPKDI